jgi:hypothetical protein
VEGLVCTTDTVESIAKLGYSTVSDLKARTFGDGEPIPV